MPESGVFIRYFFKSFSASEKSSCFKGTPL